MKNSGSSAFARAIGTVLVLAMAAYMAAGLCSALTNDLSWAVVSHRSVERFFSAQGTVIRSEIPLEGGHAPEARRLGAGDSMGDGLSAPASGLFFSSGDGYEYLSPEHIPLLDAGSISRLNASPDQALSGPRLVTGKDWYFAALLPSGFDPAPGTELQVDFGLGEINAVVLSSGDGFAVLHMDTQLAEHASLRKVEARIISEIYSGLALPKTALRTQDGESFVWVAAAGRLEKKKVNIVFTGTDFVLVSLSPEAGALREGDRVLTGGEDLYEGKIIK